MVRKGWKKERTELVRKNDVITLNIHDIHRDGMGVGRYTVDTADDTNKQGIAVFVEGALPGDVLKVKILKVKKNYAYGKIEEITTLSPGRLPPNGDICWDAKRCGGCIFQHYAYSYQLEFKTKIVRDALTRIGHCENPPMRDIIGMENPYRYRNKAQFVVDEHDGLLTLGFYAPRSHDFVWIDNCPIHHSICDVVIRVVGDMPAELGLQTLSGLLLHVIVKVGFATGEVMVVLVVASDDFPEQDKAKWVKALSVISGCTSVVLNINTTKSNVILGSTFETLYGGGYVHEIIGHIRYRISARAFFQVNPVQTKVMYDTVREFGDFIGTELVIDAHTGIGGIGLYVAEHVKEVIGVEIIPEAVEDAIYNANLNGIANVQFLKGAAEEIIPEMLGKGTVPDVLIFDPPRKGCAEPLINAAINAKISKIIYVSCDPATLARDITLLDNGGYQLEKVQPIDMFPMTGHVETVCLLVRKSANPLV